MNVMAPRSQDLPIIDPFGRRISYVRLSVTDRCDLRCAYCMAEEMTFLPRRDLLSLEELERLGTILVSIGIERIRITGGEPFMRRDLMHLIAGLSRHLATGALRELTLTTNGTRLARFAHDLRRHGVRRVNVSLDSRDPSRFKAISRFGDLGKVLDGLTAAREAGLAVKINMVALRGVNEDEIEDMLLWCAGQGFDLTLIETMPMGEVEEDRTDRYLSLQSVRERLERRYSLTPSPHRTGGPARYFETGELGVRLGLITPMSGNFCDGCNRIRIACTGTLYPCLGQGEKVELREILRATERDDDVRAALLDAVALKPKGHDFEIGHGLAPSVARHMNVTGG